MTIKLNRKEALKLIDSIESGGGDATALRDALGGTTTETESLEPETNDFIDAMKKDSPLVEGDDLKCAACGSKTTRLWSQVCEQCFTTWTLSAKKGYLRVRRKKDAS